jgi:hypothetical protein
MKKILALSFLFFLFAQTGGLLYLYSLQQKWVQMHMEEELNNPNAKFETICMSRGDFEKGRKNSFEVQWQGKMYDVKQIVFEGDKVSMLALHDVKEESLMHEIEKLFCNAEDKGHMLPNLLLKISSLTYLLSFVQMDYSGTPNFILDYKYYISPAAYLISQDVSTPPPNFV